MINEYNGGGTYKTPLPINCLLNTPVMMFKNLKEMTYKILLNKMLFPMITKKTLQALQDVFGPTLTFVTTFLVTLCVVELIALVRTIQFNNDAKNYVEQLENHIENLGVSVMDTDGGTDAYYDYYSW